MRSLAVTENKELKIVEVPLPHFGDYHALVKMEACGVCSGTDLKLAHHQFKNFSAYPALLGHEGVGRVVETGSRVRSFRAGDRVLLPFVEEPLGGYASGWGAYSEYAVVGDGPAMTADGRGPGSTGFSEAWLAQQVIPESIPSAEATLIVTFREVRSAMKRFGFKPNMSVVVFGLGPVGSVFVKFSRLLGLSPVIAVDIDDHKVQRAARFGADHAFNSKNRDVGEAVRELLPGGADLVVDAVGINDLINTGLQLIKNCGKMCCYGISPRLDMHLDWNRAPYNWSLDFVQWPSKLEESEAHSQVISWIALGALDPAQFISKVIPFDDILTAFQDLEEKKTDLKTVIVFDK